MIAAPQGSRFLRVWAIVMGVGALLLGSLSVFTFGLVCFSGLFILWLKDRNRRVSSALDVVNGVMLLTTVVWFAANIVVEFSPSPITHTSLLVLAFVYPPLILHLNYLEAKSAPKAGWKAVLILLYVAGPASMVFLILSMAGFLIGFGYQLILVCLVALSLQFGISGVSSAVLVAKGSRLRQDQRRRKVRRVNLALLVGMALTFLVIALSAVTQSYFEGFSRLMFDLTTGLSVISRSLPLIFLLLNTYYESRFEFFDVFVKRATLFFLLLASLVAYFGIAIPLIEQRDFEPWLQPWVYALTLVPLVILVPKIYQSLGSWLDRHWLGRTLTPVEAVKFFMEGLQEATGAKELGHVAEERLGEIFHAPVGVHLGGERSTEFPVILRVPLRGEEVGVILMGPRPNQSPYFSEDVTLISALADVFAYLLQNVRLQERKQEQERREKELVLSASRSELKALRAQINPHFLFNALNVIASLTHRDPDLAEATVEQLSEVFRYTLSRSEKEWVRLVDEVEFIQAYLEVEKARFGDRMQVSVRLEDGVADCLVPTMMIQTLVENAVKHGISRVKGAASLSLEAARTGEDLRIRVCDNGPGFEGGRSDEGRPSGYGLSNIQSRLDGYYGDAARLEIGRDLETGTTRVTLTLPARSELPMTLRSAGG